VTLPDDSEHKECGNGGHLGAPHQSMPSQWTMAAARLPGRTLHLAMTIQALAVANNSSRVALSNIVSLQFGLDRSAKYRALACLERAGLVSVERKLGRSPIVTLLCNPIEDNG
jgi:hypothetical protein